MELDCIFNHQYRSSFIDVSNYRSLHLNCYTDSPLRLFVDNSMHPNEDDSCQNMYTQTYLVGQLELLCEAIPIRTKYIRVRILLVDGVIYPLSVFKLSIWGPQYDNVLPPYPAPIAPVNDERQSYREKKEELSPEQMLDELMAKDHKPSGSKIRDLLKGSRASKRNSESHNSTDWRIPSYLPRNSLLICAESSDRLCTLPIGGEDSVLCVKNGKIAWDYK